MTKVTLPSDTPDGAGRRGCVKERERDTMQRGRYIHLAVLVALTLAAGTARPAQAQGTLQQAQSAFQAIPQADGTVFLTWNANPTPGVVGYNLYRRDSTLTVDKAALVNADKPLTTTSMIDKGAPLAKSATYFMRPVFQDAAGKLSEGPNSAQAEVMPQNPIALPPGSFLSYDIDTLNPGSATLASNALTIRASGPDLWSTSDGQTFVGMPVAGNYQISAAIMAAPAPDPAASNPNDWAKFGVEIRASPLLNDPGSWVFTSVNRDPGVLYEGRQLAGGDTNPVAGDGLVFSDPGAAQADLVFPLYLRLLKQGSKITAFQSLDSGKTYTQVGSVYDFGPGNLGPVTYAGVFATAARDGQYDIVKFDATSIKIEPK